MRRNLLRSIRRAGALAGALLCVAVPLFGLHGQTPAARAPAGKIFGVDDFARLNRITSPSLSADGKWMTFTYSPNEGGQTILHVKALDGSRDYTVTMAGTDTGSAGGGGRGNAPSFSNDSRWVVYLVTPESRTAGRAARGRDSAATPPGGRGATAAREPATVAHLELLNVATGEKFSVPGAASWKFSRDSRWLAVKLNRTPGAARAAETPGGEGQGARGGANKEAGARGADMIVRDLARGAVRNIGNVAAYEFDDAGRLCQ